MSRFVTVSIEDRLRAWRDRDAAAAEAERAVAAMGQASADPGTRDLLLQAKRLRDEADRDFAAICRAIRIEDQDGPSPAI